MIDLWIEELGEHWFAVAHHEERLVATAVASDRETLLSDVTRMLPSAAPHRLLREASPFLHRTVRMLADLEAGNEAGKCFELSERFLSDEQRRTLRAAAAIPVGYVATYGAIGDAAGTIARRVGHIMATNPIYPIVPCHRVVGAQFALVGYGGRRDAAALESKLARLRREARGRSPEEAIVEGFAFPLYPVELVLERASRGRQDEEHQLPLFGSLSV